MLLVDVDGVVSLFGFGAVPPAGLVATAVDGIPHFLSPQDRKSTRLNSSH